MQMCLGLFLFEVNRMLICDERNKRRRICIPLALSREMRKHDGSRVFLLCGFSGF